MVRDRIVFGTKFSKVREKLIHEGSDLCSQANGQAERFVQTAKNLIKKSKDPSIGIHC
jgi:hypothetical protein